MSHESGVFLQSAGTVPRIAMAEIVRVFNEEKEALGWGAKRRFYMTTEQRRAYELIEAKLDAAESHPANVARAAEGRARASYMRYEKICRPYRDDLATGNPKAH